MNTIFAATILLLLSQQPTIPSATLEGRILHPDNSPAAGMKVELLQQIANTEGMRQWLTVERGSAITDDRGQFRMTGFAPGKYYLRAIQRPPVTSGTLSSPSGVEWTPTTYFPGILNAALASPVEITAGQPVNVHLAIPQSNPYTVSGRIMNSVPGQTQPIRLVLLRRDYGAPLEANSSSLETLNLAPGTDGKFEIRGVPSGSYELHASTQGQSTTPGPPGANLLWVARVTFDVSDRDIDDISAILQPADVK